MTQAKTLEPYREGGNWSFPLKISASQKHGVPESQSTLLSTKQTYKCVHLHFYKKQKTKKKRGDITCVIAWDKLKIIHTHIYIYSEAEYKSWFGFWLADLVEVFFGFFSNYTKAVLKLCAAQRHCLLVCTEMLIFILLEQ